jgi:hypothetical protein
MKYKLRESQVKAIKDTIAYFNESQETQPSFLWNAVMRWGKCLTSLNFVHEYNEQVTDPKKLITDVLILTFFPSTEDSWSRLFNGGEEAQDNFKDFNFISVNTGKRIPGKVNVFFTSFQEIYTGKQKKEMFYQQNYQLLILDEYHYGAYNGKAKSTLKQISSISDSDLSLKDTFEKDNRINYHYRLTLSGTPYKTQIQDEFIDKSNVFRFNYFDEQRDRADNPNSDYKDSPQLELYSVNMNREETSLFNRIDFLFKNTEIFGKGKKRPLFLDGKFGASFWLIPSVNDGKLIEKYVMENYSKLGYNVINLNNTNKDSLGYLRENLKKNKDKYNIILSFNKLTLGVTIPEIENIVFLREISTAELYMQAGSRAKSQYKDNIKKDKAHLISFDIDNDFNIFQQITANDIDEKEFVRLFPIKFVDYDIQSNTATVSDITGEKSFLDALAKVPLSEMIRKTVAARAAGSNFVIPDDILAALNKISGIGHKKSPLTEQEIDELNQRTNKKLPTFSPAKAAEKDGFTAGAKDKELGRNLVNTKKYHDEVLQAVYEKGYKKGLAYEGKGDEEISPSISEDEAKKRKESNAEVIKKIQLLIERFLYILIGAYYRENKFMDIQKAPAEFFASMLGFDENLFIRLYEEFIIDNNYINNMVSTFKSKENINTSYLGLSNPDDYDFIDLDELTKEKAEEQQIEKVESIIDGFKDMIDFNEIMEEELDNKNSILKFGKKYIYIAKPSEFLKGMILSFQMLKGFLPETSEVKNKVIDYISYFSELAVGVKIGETHRDPSVRVDELNGYTDKHLLFDIDTFLEVPEEKSDREFHKLLEEKGYERIKAGTRRERFNMTPEQAKKELNNYIKDKKEIDYSKLSPEELIELLKQRDKELN